MGVWKSLVDGMREKRDELARRAAKKAARTAVSSAGKMVDGVSKAIEDAIFGDGDGAKADDASPEATTDPFAKLKAAEAEKKEREREEKRLAKERVAAQKKADREVDAELAALKKKLGK